MTDIRRTGALAAFPGTSKTPAALEDRAGPFPTVIGQTSDPEANAPPDDFYGSGLPLSSLAEELDETGGSSGGSEPDYLATTAEGGAEFSGLDRLSDSGSSGGPTLPVDAGADDGSSPFLSVQADFIARAQAILDAPFAAEDVEIFVPDLREGVAISPDIPTGLRYQIDLPQPEGTVSLSLVAELTKAFYCNTLGAYSIDEDGNITDVRLLMKDVRDFEDGSSVTYTGEPGASIGFFIVKDGSGWASTLAEADVLDFIDRTDGEPANLADGAAVQLTVNGAALGLDVYHSHDGSLNRDGMDHVVSWQSDGNIFIGFEDKFRAGDMDFQDVVIQLGALPPPDDVFT